MTITWDSLTEADLPALRDLARACLDADGGLPILTSDGLLRARLLGGATLAARDDTGALVAAAGWRCGTARRRPADWCIRPSVDRGSGDG